VVKILETSTNPFAIVVQAHLKTQETRKDEKRRLTWKVALTKALYQRGFQKIEILALYQFIDWLMRLPDDLDQRCFQEISAFEEKHHIPYITTLRSVAGITVRNTAGVCPRQTPGVEK